MGHITHTVRQHKQTNRWCVVRRTKGGQFRQIPSAGNYGTRHEANKALIKYMKENAA